MLVGGAIVTVIGTVTKDVIVATVWVVVIVDVSVVVMGSGTKVSV